MNVTLRYVISVAIVSLSVAAFAADPPAAEKAPVLKPLAVVDVWPGTAPGEKGDIGPEKETPQRPGQKQVVRLTNVSKPTLTVYAPPKDKANGAAVVICPGGGYSILAMDLEGEEVAAWLNSLGVTGIVLKYRVPARKGLPRHLPPLQDAQRAVSLVRAKAGEWGVDPKRIGILGFSAGGHLAAATATAEKRIYGPGDYEPADRVEAFSCRPDFAVLVYPAYFLDKQNKEFAPEICPGKGSPPAFLAHAGDDRIPAENSVRFYEALHKAGVPAQLHVFAQGGHGFGLRNDNPAAIAWPKLCGEWMAQRKLLAPQE